MEVTKITSANFDFERFLNDEKDNFCKFRCQYSKGKPIKVECGYCIIDCYECEESINIEGENIEIEPCEYCVIDEFIREIRDCNFKVLE